MKRTNGRVFGTALDKGIARAVNTLMDARIECFESCQGGKGHARPEPFIKFSGEQPEGLKALSVAMYAGLNVTRLQRVWDVQDGEIVGPWWELNFSPTKESH